MKLWIARSKTGVLNLCVTEPQRFYGGFFMRTHRSGEIISLDNCNIEGEWLRLDSDLFPEVTFENSPQQVELKLVKEE